MTKITPNSSNGNNQPANAKIAVQLCNAASALDPVSYVKEHVSGWSVVWNGVQTFDANYAFIAADSAMDNYALVIRGSVIPGGTFSDWDAFANWILEDLDIVTQVSWSYASSRQPRISSGAYRAFSNLLEMNGTNGESLTQFLAANIANRKPLMITGHSLGGNMASVFASYYVQTLLGLHMKVDNISLYTFAAPAAGNADFATDLDQKLPNAYHYHNINDIVPNFPVFDGFVFVSSLYLPKPLAYDIKVTHEGHTLRLNEAILMLAGVFLLYGYQQPSNNYTIFNSDLYPLDPTKTPLEQWLAQGGMQHQVVNYAKYLGITLPSLQQASFAQLV